MIRFVGTKYLCPGLSTNFLASEIALVSLELSQLYDVTSEPSIKLALKSKQAEPVVANSGMYADSCVL